MPADVVATVMVLQALEGVSNHEAADALRLRIDWKVACGLALDDEGIHPTTLTYWRNRLADRIGRGEFSTREPGDTTPDPRTLWGSLLTPPEVKPVEPLLAGHISYRCGSAARTAGSLFSAGYALMAASSVRRRFACSRNRNRTVWPVARGNNPAAPPSGSRTGCTAP